MTQQEQGSVVLSFKQLAVLQNPECRGKAGSRRVHHQHLSGTAKFDAFATTLLLLFFPFSQIPLGSWKQLKFKTAEAKAIPEAGWGDKKTPSPAEWRPQTSEQVSEMGNRARGDRRRKVNRSQAQHAGRQSWADSDKCWTWAKHGGSWWWGELEKLSEARTCNFSPPLFVFAIVLYRLI